MSDDDLDDSHDLDAGTPLLPECEFAADIPRDSQGCLPVGALTAAKDCRISHGDCFTLMNPDNAFGTRKEKTRMAKPPKHPAPTPEVAPEVAPEAAPEEAEEQAPPLPAPARAPLVPQAHTEVPAPHTAASELSALMPKDASGGAISVMLALIAVAGGGAGWKFYQSFAKQKHEERMKQLEIEATRVEKVEAVNAERAADLAEAQRAEQKDDSHQKCSAERATLEGKVEALEARLVEAEKAAREAAEAAKAATTTATATAEAVEKPKEITIDFDEIEQRIAEIEKALKKAPPDKAKKPAKAKKT